MVPARSDPPLDSLNVKWAWMVMMTCLAWTLKQWAALLIPVNNLHQAKHRADADRLLKMEFRTFMNSIIKIPAQVISTGRQTLLRLLQWNPSLPIMLRLSKILE